MVRLCSLLFLVAGCTMAEVHSFTLRQALELAAKQSPDVTLARLDQQYTQQGVAVALDPFRPKVYAGSGLAYTYGYPNSIEGNAPSIGQVKTDMFLYNRSKSLALAEAKENARGSQFGAQAKAEDVAYQAAGFFLSALQQERESKMMGEQLVSLQNVVDSSNAAVEEGTQLPLEVKRAKVNLAVTEQRLDSARLDTDYYEMLLAVALGFPADDRVKPIESDLTSLEAPPDQTAAEEMVLQQNKELKQMQSRVLAKELDIRSYRAARLPQVGLVAQYAYFARYNYEQYFPPSSFRHNNYQIGASVQVPLLVGTASKGLAAQAATEMVKIRVQMDQTRNRLLADTRRNYDLWRKAEKLQNLSRMQLDLAREELNVKLAQNAEGRVSLSQLEPIRIEENNRWMAYYEAQLQEIRARLAILKQTGSLLSAVRGMPVSPMLAPTNP
jgi:outer membrane protein